jgi:hypothetical protein
VRADIGLAARPAGLGPRRADSADEKGSSGIGYRINAHITLHSAAAFFTAWRRHTLTLVLISLTPEPLNTPRGSLMMP